MGLFGEEQVQGRFCGSLPVSKGGLPERWRGTFYKATFSGRTRGNGFKLKEHRFRLEIREKFFPVKGSEALEWAGQRICGYPTPEMELRWSSEQPGLPMAGGLKNMIFKVPSNQNYHAILK